MFVLMRETDIRQAHETRLILVLRASWKIESYQVSDTIPDTLFEASWRKGDQLPYAFHS